MGLARQGSCTPAASGLRRNPRDKAGPAVRHPVETERTHGATLIKERSVDISQQQICTFVSVACAHACIACQPRGVGRPCFRDELGHHVGARQPRSV